MSEDILLDEINRRIKAAFRVDESFLDRIEGDPDAPMLESSIRPDPMKPIIYLPVATKRVQTDTIAFTNRFSVRLRGGNRIIIAQHRKLRWWACSCSFFKRTDDCIHLRRLGIPGNKKRIELTLQAVDFTVFSDGNENAPFTTDYEQKVLEQLRRPSKTAAATNRETEQAKPSARRIVLNEDV